MSKGWQRPGPGRKPIDPDGERRKAVTIMLTPHEEARVRQFVKLIRGEPAK